MNILYQKPFFTDGSKTEEVVAAAAVSTKRIKNPFTCRLPDDSSIYELRAILLALKHVYYSKVKSFLILSGSLSSLESILKLRCINWVQGEVVKKNEPGRLGTTQCEFVPTCLVKWVPPLPSSSEQRQKGAISSLTTYLPLLSPLTLRHL